MIIIARITDGFSIIGCSTVIYHSTKSVNRCRCMIVNLLNEAISPWSFSNGGRNCCLHRTALYKCSVWFGEQITFLYNYVDNVF